MAFCNSCGAPLDAGTKFCSKCGAVAAAPPAAAAPATSVPGAAPPASTGGSSALKIILIAIGIIVLIGILGIASFSFFVYRVAKSARVTQHGDNVKVETPFGSVESSKDPAQVTKDLGVDIYPGADILKNGASTASFGPIHTVTAMFESSDPLDKVCAFYKEKFPSAMTTSSDANRCTIVSNDQKNMITVNIESTGDGSKFQITNVSKKSN
jgi:hypothetical protein